MQLPKLFTVVLIITLLSVGGIGVAYSGSLMAQGNTHMVGCPLMGHDAALCDMSLLAHLEHWQTAFTATLYEIVILLGAVIVFAFWRERTYADLQLTRSRQRARDPVPAPLFQELCSRGILHRKDP